MFDIFKIAGNDNFFDILSRPTKEAYWNVINLLYDEVMSIYEIRISRSEARRLIEMFLSEYNKETEKCTMEPHAFLSTYIDTGWLIQRYDGEEGDDFLYFTPFAINFIKTMEDTESALDTIHSEDYLKRIYFIAKDILEGNIESDAYKYPFRNGLGKITRLLNDCFYHLSTIEQKNQEDVRNILETNDLQELIDKLTVYIDDLNNGYIHDVYEGFNLTELYRKKIVDLIYEIEANAELKEKIFWDMKERYKNSYIKKTDDELIAMLSNMLNKLENRIEGSYPAYKSRIDANVQNLISKSLHKMNMLSEGGASHVNTLNRVIELMAFLSERDQDEAYENDETTKELFAKSVSFHKLKIVDTESLFKKREISQKEEMEPVEILEIEEEIDLDKLETEHFSLEDANKYANRYFSGDNREIKVSNIIFDEDTITQLQGVCLLSDSVGAEYTVEFTGERVVKNGYEFDDFIIKKL